MQSDAAGDLTVETVAEGLEHPWALAVLPEGAMLVTKQAGRLRVVADGALRPDPVAGLPEVFARKQGGLLDVAAGPDLAEDRMIYWTYAKPTGNGTSATAAARGRLSEDQSHDALDIFVQHPASTSPLHYGSRLAFDGAGHVFITTGEHSVQEERVRAQDLTMSYGKVVRLGLDGAPPADNPFADEGDTRDWRALDRRARPKGGGDVNLIEAGANAEDGALLRLSPSGAEGDAVAN